MFCNWIRCLKLLEWVDMNLLIRLKYSSSYAHAMMKQQIFRNGLAENADFVNVKFKLNLITLVWLKSNAFWNGWKCFYMAKINTNNGFNIIGFEVVCYIFIFVYNVELFYHTQCNFILFFLSQFFFSWNFFLISNYWMQFVFPRFFLWNFQLKMFHLQQKWKQM